MLALMRAEDKGVMRCLFSILVSRTNSIIKIQHSFAKNAAVGHQAFAAGIQSSHNAISMFQWAYIHWLH